jgi:nicotinamidase-related amidase
MLVSLLALMLVFLCTAALMVFRGMFMATKGKRISTYDNPRAALVVLDIQEGYAGTGTPQPVATPQGSGLIATVNRIIDQAAATGMEVAYVRQVFGHNLIVRLHGGRSQGRVIIDRRLRIINDNDFAKNRTDAFSNRQFEQFLIDRQVNELYLVGVDAAYCVLYTALGALQRGYRVTVVSDAVRSRQPMARVMERYRRHGIAVTTSDRLTGSA